jgi:phosphoketolase
MRAEHVKPRLLGHWGTTPGLNLLYAHMNRVIIERDLNVLYDWIRSSSPAAWASSQPRPGTVAEGVR